MSKWKERILKVLDKEKERLEAKLYEAEGNYRDTGYTRYYNQIETLRAELDEIETYRNSSLAVATAESEIRRYRQAVQDFRDSMAEFVHIHKGAERSVEATVKALESRLDMAFLKRGAK